MRICFSLVVDITLKFPMDFVEFELIIFPMDFAEFELIIECLKD